jgi:putative ubiquitin-RnfH superfamily antitoxin RatB of RatAB toxin-antitoxin module
LSVQVAYSPVPEQVDLRGLHLPVGATVADALRASGLLEQHSLILDQNLVCGVWAKIRPLSHPLRDGDRVEVYRPLRVDPKEARRQRYRKGGKPAKGRTVAGPGQAEGSEPTIGSTKGTSL